MIGPIDSIASITLTALAFSVTAALLLASPADAIHRRRLGLSLAAWFALVTALGAGGVFATAGLGTPAVGAAVAFALTAALIVAAAAPALRAVITRVPLEWLVGIHVGRLLGVFFLLLYAARRLPPTFALSAGWGDVLVALAALPVAWSASSTRRRPPVSWERFPGFWSRRSSSPSTC